MLRSLPTNWDRHAAVPCTEKKNARRAAAWLGLEAVPRCRLRVDQGLGSLVGLLQADVTGSEVTTMNEAVERDARVACGADRARGGLKEG